MVFKPDFFGSNSDNQTMPAHRDKFTDKLHGSKKWNIPIPLCGHKLLIDGVNYANCKAVNFYVDFSMRLRKLDLFGW